MFCWVKGAEEYGFGKVVEIEGENCIVDYFNSPTTPVARRVTVPTHRIIKKNLGANTTIFTLNQNTNQWLIGRVLEDNDERVEVRFANKQDYYLPYEEVFVRWKIPIEDPIEFLSNLLTEPPQFAEARSGFMRSYISQRRAAFGISALLSSSIELEPHQVEVVRRVLTDHTQRYLLADEVGLGKTIEAGIIIRQAVLDDIAGHRVIILVPQQLVGQWREELINRFGMKYFLDKSVFVFPHEDSEELRETAKNLTLLVVDEAHHLTAKDSNEATGLVYDLVSKTAQQVDKLLLLSATPILRNEEGFLRMLNLLDPVVYPLEDLDGFRAKVVTRQALAETVAALDPSNVLMLDSVLDDLLHRLPNDSRLDELTQNLQKKLVGIPDEDDPEIIALILQLRAHISETYRLNRRILRNRRIQVEGLTPEREGVELCRVTGSSMERMESLLEGWRLEASLASERFDEERTAELETFYWNAVRSLFESLPEFLMVCKERQNFIQNDLLPTFDGEEALLAEVERGGDVQSWLQQRLERLTEIFETLPKAVKVVIFCASETTAEQIFHHLKQQRRKLVRHTSSPTDESIDGKSWQVFLSDPAVQAIVCDQRAEEGINLQGGNKIIIHFDLPLQPNRIEQRMGRVDRYGAGKPVRSYVLHEEGAPLHRAWFRILDEGLGVFDRSISSLQYLVDSEVTNLSRTLFHNGVDGLHDLLDSMAGISGTVAQELRLIDHQDALDQLGPVPEQELDELFDVDDDWKEIGKAMDFWIEKTLMFDRVKLRRQNGKQSIDEPFRFHYRPPDKKSRFSTKSTLIPLSNFLDDFPSTIDFGAPGNSPTRPKSYPYATYRTTAVKHNLRPLRYGTEFIESIRSFSEVDVRGRSYAIWRQVANQMEMRMCFRFDFLIETYLEEAMEVLTQAELGSNESVRSSLLRRGDSLFQPTMIQVWTDEDGEELEESFIEQYLNRPYSKDGCKEYIDKNLDVHFTKFKQWSPGTFENWEVRCQRIRDKALDIVNSKPELQERKQNALERALAEDEIRYAQLRTRIQALDGIEASAEAQQLNLEEALNKALQNGISSPMIKIDVVGVVFLTSDPVSIIKEIERDQE